MGSKRYLSQVQSLNSSLPVLSIFDWMFLQVYGVPLSLTACTSGMKSAGLQSMPQFCFFFLFFFLLFVAFLVVVVGFFVVVSFCVVVAFFVLVVGCFVVVCFGGGAEPPVFPFPPFPPFPSAPVPLPLDSNESASS